MEISSFSEECTSFSSFVQNTQPSSSLSFTNSVKRSKLLDDPVILDILNKFMAYEPMADDETKPEDCAVFFNPMEQIETKEEDCAVFSNPMEQVETKEEDCAVFFNPMEQVETKEEDCAVFFNPMEQVETKEEDCSIFFNSMEQDEMKIENCSIFFNSTEQDELKIEDCSIFFNSTEQVEEKPQDSSKKFSLMEQDATKPQECSIFFNPMEQDETKPRESLISFSPTEQDETKPQESFISFNSMAQNEPKLEDTSIFFNTNNTQQINETDSFYSNSYTPGLVRSGSTSNKRSHSEFDNVLPTLDEITSFVNGGVQAQRRLWVKDRSTAWWDLVNTPDFTEKEFKEAFRMSRDTFDMICDELDLSVTKKNTMLRNAIPVRQRVAVCIWRLATGASLRQVSQRFGLGISTCHKLVLEVCAAIKTVLMPKFLQWPDHKKMKDIKKEFEAFSGIPNVGGSIYTTHVSIIAPKVSVASYFNKRHTERNGKTSYSVTVQGVVDHNGTFTDICVGWPGSMTDDQILEKSALFQRANKGALKDVRVVGHSGYPLMDWVMVPYSHSQNKTWAQNSYNEKVENVQKVAKGAFMRFKGRWNCLRKRTDIKLQELPIVLGACCVLHNICEMRNEEFSEDLKFELFDDEVIPKYSVRSVNAINDRNQVAQKILHQHQQ